MHRAALARDYRPTCRAPLCWRARRPNKGLRPPCVATIPTGRSHTCALQRGPSSKATSPDGARERTGGEQAHLNVLHGARV